MDKDLIELCMGFDDGTLTASEYLHFGAGLISSGLVNSTGSYQRFVGSLTEAGYLTTDGTFTEHALEFLADHEGE